MTLSGRLSFGEDFRVFIIFEMTILKVFPKPLSFGDGFGVRFFFKTLFFYLMQ